MRIAQPVNEESEDKRVVKHKNFSVYLCMAALCTLPNLLIIILCTVRLGPDHQQIAKNPCRNHGPIALYGSPSHMCIRQYVDGELLKSLNYSVYGFFSSCTQDFREPTKTFGII